MIINPSVFYPHIRANVWSYFNTPFMRDIWDVACTCKSLLALPRLTIIECTPMSVCEGTRLWQGLCPNCNRSYWSCNNFNWVALLTDAQFIETVLAAIPISHTKINGNTGIIVNSEILSFEDGNLIRGV